MEDYLPKTRKEVLHFCFRKHLGSILRLDLLSLLAFLPILFALIFKESYYIGILQKLTDASTEDVLALGIQTNLIFGLLEALALLLFIFLLAGAVRVIRQLFWQEMYSFGSAFRDGIRYNTGRFLLVGLFLVLPAFVLNCLVSTVPTRLLYWAYLLIYLPICIWTLLQSAYYEQKLWPSVRNSVILMIHSLPETLLLTAVSVLPFYFLSNISPLTLIKYFIILGLALLYIIPITMIWMLYASHIFDKFINKEHFPDYYRRGMQP